MYDPTIGRWISEDPMGFEAGDANLYRYVGNDPTNATDPSGLKIARVRMTVPGGSVITYVYLPDNYRGTLAQYLNLGEMAGASEVSIDNATQGLINLFLGDPQKERDIVHFLNRVADTSVFPNFWPILDSQCVRWTNALMNRMNRLSAQAYPRNVRIRQVTLPYPADGGPQHSIILVKAPNGNQAFGVDNGALGGNGHVFDPLAVYRNTALPQETRDALQDAMREFTQNPNWPNP